MGDIVFISDEIDSIDDEPSWTDSDRSLSGAIDAALAQAEAAEADGSYTVARAFRRALAELEALVPGSDHDDRAVA